MKHLLDQMEEHIAEIRNLQRNFDFHSRRLEKLMKALEDHFRVSRSAEESLSSQSNAND